MTYLLAALEAKGNLMLCPANNCHFSCFTGTVVPVTVSELAVCLQQASRTVPCPTCRQKAPLGDIAYVDAGHTAAREANGSSEAQHEEEEIYVRGSYSTKVRPAHTPIPPFTPYINHQ